MARRVPEFLVHIIVNAPPDMPAARKRELVEAEARRGRELIDQGSLLRIWRLPGRWANVSLYRCADWRGDVFFAPSGLAMS